MTDRLRQNAPASARLLAGLLLLGAVVLPAAHRTVGHPDARPSPEGPAVENVHAVCALCATVLVAVVSAAAPLVAAGPTGPFVQALPAPAGVAVAVAARGRAPPLG